MESTLSALSHSGFHTAAALSSSCSADFLSHSGVGTGAMAGDGDDLFLDAMEEINATDLIDSDFADCDDEAPGECVVVPKAGEGQSGVASSSKKKATQCSCFCCGDIVVAAIWLLPLFVVS